MTWEQFDKTFQPWGIQIPDLVAPIKIKTREGEVVAEGGDYLMVDSEGYLYPIAEEELETVYDRV